MQEKVVENVRNVALVGPYSSGKTTLLESLLFVTDRLTRKGSIKERNTLGDSSPEAREHQMSVEISLGDTVYQDTKLQFIDCPGSVEFIQETDNALVGAGAAIVVCEPVVEKVLTLAPLFKFLDDWEIPHIVFINKMDRASADYRDILTALKQVSSRPLVPQQYPIQKGREIIGYIDLITEQAYHYHSGSAADPVPIPPELAEAEKQARATMLESLADFDDHLLEELLEDIEPPTQEVIKDFKQELGADQIVPVCFGMAEQDYGVRPLLDILHKEAPAPDVTAKRRGLQPQKNESTIAQVLKTTYTAQGGRMSVVRVWQGQLIEGMNLNGVRAGGIYHLFGQQTESIGSAKIGAIVGVSRLEGIQTGDTLSDRPEAIKPLPRVERIKPVYALAIAPENRKDEVKITNAIAKLVEEDPGLDWQQHGDTHEVILWGQGEIQLKVAMERLERKYNLPMRTHLPQVPYKETIRKTTKSHGKYKHQTGGHGAFGDVYLEIKPLSRGEGFSFHETIVGGVVPRQYIPGVEMGVREYLSQGPLGFPVVDIDVTLTDGSYHSVDSSEQAFKQAARIAMTEGMQKCQPVLLEPILTVKISAPSEFTSRVLQLVTTRRGQILGFEPVSNWQGWDQITAYLPQAQMQDLIIELRSLTLGVGFFGWEYDHLEQVPEKITENILARQNESL